MMQLMASDLNEVNGIMARDKPHLVFMHCVCHHLTIAHMFFMMTMPLRLFFKFTLQFVLRLFLYALDKIQLLIITFMYCSNC